MKGCSDTSMPSARASRPITSPLLPRQIEIEGGGHAHGGGLGLRGMAGEHAGRPIGKAQAGNAQARNARDISGLALIDGGVFAAVVDQGQFFRERHLRQQLVDPRIAGDGRRRGLCLRQAERRSLHRTSR